MKSRKGTVFSTELRSVCPGCGWPKEKCTCSKPSVEEIPSRIRVRLRISRAGRRGKTVTLIEGLPRNPEFLARLARDLKKSCGVGGRVGEDFIEIQGDTRERIREILLGKGWIVRG